jgi:hypothetical protein
VGWNAVSAKSLYYFLWCYYLHTHLYATQTDAVLDPNLPIPCSVCSDILVVRIASICCRCSSGGDSFCTPINKRYNAKGTCTWETDGVNISCCRHTCSSLAQQVFAATYQFTSIKPVEISKGSCGFDAINLTAGNLWITQFQGMFIQKPNSGFGGLEDACWPLVHKFAGSNLDEAVGFFRAKNSPARLPSEGK